MSRSALLLMGILIALCATPSVGQTKKKRPQPRPVAPRTELIAVIDEHMPEAWKQFTSTAGEFSILFPGDPSETTEVESIPAGKVTEHHFQLITAIAMYNANVAEGPVKVDAPEITRLALDSMRNDVLERNKGKLLSETDMTIEGHSGRQVVWRTEKGLLMKARFILSGNRVYSLVFGVPDQSDLSDETRSFRESIATKFFDSFRISQ